MASRNIKDLDARLQSSFAQALETWQAIYPGMPAPFLTCTYRSNIEQEALYAQGRKPLEIVNELRKKALLAPIGKTEGKKRITAASAGKSKHNLFPSMAFDIAFINSQKKLDWSEDLFVKFYNIIVKINPEIVWGGHFKSGFDGPHFQLGA